MKNSLKYAKVLEESGLSRKVAETHIQVLENVMEGEMATKSDVADVSKRIDTLDHDLNLKIDTVEERLSLKIDTLRKDMNKKFLALENRLTIKLGGLMAVYLGAALAAVKLLSL